MNKVYQLLAAAIATLVCRDKAGQTISPPAGSTVAWTSSDPGFATVTPGADGFSATITPTDPTDTAVGSAVITATLVNPDGSQVVATGVVANSDDVTAMDMGFAPVPAGPEEATPPA